MQGFYKTKGEKEVLSLNALIKDRIKAYILTRYDYPKFDRLTLGDELQNIGHSSDGILKIFSQVIMLWT